MMPEAQAPEGAGQHRLRLPTFNDLIRILRQGNEFLSRLQVGGPMVARSADFSAKPLVWGALNRASMPFNMNVSLPAIDPIWVGVPLYFVKMDHGGTTTATGRALGAPGKPKINDAAQYAATAARLYVFVTDGTNWFAGGA
mgnify:FL=1